jgi:enamine deaminase RidA (YjgF/YER057c/UK114 family)
MDFDAKLDELFIDLPEPPTPAAGTAHAVQAGKFLYISGVLPLSEGKIQTKGRVGLELRLDSAKLAARTAAVNALAVIATECGGTLNKVKRIIEVTGYISSGGEFRQHFKVLDGVAELFSQVFGPAGKHTRNAVGCANLPNDACIELSLIVELK